MSQRDAGTCPLRSLVSNRKVTRLLRLPRDSGIEPESLLAFACRVLSKSSEPTALGKTPLKEFSFTSSLVSSDRHPREMGRIPTVQNRKAYKSEGKHRAT